MSNANGADGQPISITLIVPHQGTEKDFIKAAVREARIHARASWRSRTVHVVNKGGRPSLKQAVWAACDVQWALWGEQFPPNCSTALALVQRVSKGVRVTYGGQLRERMDLWTITKHVRRWMDDRLLLGQAPASWLRTQSGQALIRVAAGCDVTRPFLQAHCLTSAGMLTPSAAKEWAEAMARLKQQSNQELVRAFLARRRK